MYDEMYFNDKIEDFIKDYSFKDKHQNRVRS